MDMEPTQEGGGEHPPSTKVSMRVRRRAWGEGQHHRHQPRFQPYPLLSTSISNSGHGPPGPPASNSGHGNGGPGPSASASNSGSSASNVMSNQPSINLQINNNGNTDRRKGDVGGGGAEENMVLVKVKIEDDSSDEENDDVQGDEVEEGSNENEEKKFYSAMFSKPTTKKHKTWDEDGFLIISGESVVLKNTDGQVVESSSKIKITEEMLSDCKPFRLGSKEVQIQEELSKNPFIDAGKRKPTNSNIEIPVIQDEPRLVAVDVVVEPIQEDRDVLNNERKFFTAMFAKPTTKKHKTWDEDGFIIISGKTVVLKNSDGKIVESSSKLKLNDEMLSDCKPFRLGNKEVQILDEIPNNPFNESEPEAYENYDIDWASVSTR